MTIHSANGSILELRTCLVHGRGVAEPSTLIKLLARIEPKLRADPICRFADAVITRTGNLEAANVAHRLLTEHLRHDPDALSALLCSWFEVALNLGQLELVLEIRERCVSLTDELVSATAIVATIDAAGMWASGLYAEAEFALVRVMAGSVSTPLRGPIVFLRAMSLQAQGLFDASVGVLDADANALGSFDLAGEMLRARALWINGEHTRARLMLAAVHAEARTRRRQHDSDYAAAMSRVLAQLDGAAPDLSEPAASTPRVAAIIAVGQALALAADPVAAQDFLLAHPEVLSCVPEFLAVPYVLCASMRETIDARFGDDEPSGALRSARQLVARRAGSAVATFEEWNSRNLYRPWRDELRVGSAAPLVARANAPLIRVIGPVSIERDGVVVAVRRERVRSLLVALVLHRRTTRERLSDLLWPDLAPANGANNLRTTLSYARQLFGENGNTCIRTDGAVVSLHVEVDMWKMDEAALRARVAETSGDPVAAESAWVAACDSFNGRFAEDVLETTWVESARASIETSQILALLTCAETALNSDPFAARQWAERSLLLDPWCERALTIVIERFLTTGFVAGARRNVRRAELVFDELGVSMSDRLAEVVARTLSSR